MVTTSTLVQDGNVLKGSIAESDSEICSQGSDVMAGFGSGNSTDNLGNEAVNDAKKAMSAASTGYKAYQQGKKDAKAVLCKSCWTACLW